MEQNFNENMILVKEGEVQYLKFKRLLPYEKIIKHAIGVKELGYRTMGDSAENGIQNYRKLCDFLGLEYSNIVKPLQVHGNEVKLVTEKIKENEPDINLIEYKQTDGVLTDRKNRILSTTSADCVLVLFFDPVRKVVGNVHAGWRGTFKKIVQVAVRKMIEEYGSNPEDIICLLCPSIRSCHFEVGQEVQEKCIAIFGETGNLEEIIQEIMPNEKWLIDLIEINKRLLRQMKIKEENIVDSGLCTVCHSDILHSYRVDKEKFNLNTALISLI